MLFSRSAACGQHIGRVLLVAALAVGLLLSTSAAAHTPDATAKPVAPYGQVYTYVEQMPVYPGGPAQLLHDLTANVKYPEAAVGTGVGGRVLVDFIVGPNGRVYEVKLSKGIVASSGQAAAAQALNEAAVAAVRHLKKKWQAGRQSGRAVAVSFTVPVAFTPSGN